MKKRLFLIAAMLLALTAGMKGEELSVADVQLPQDGTVAIAIELLNPSVVYDSYSFQLELPEGVVPVMGGDGYPSYNLGTRYTGSTFSGYNATTNVASFARLTDGTNITGTSGLLIAPIVKVDGVIADGTVLTARVSNIKFTKPNLTKDVLDPVEFHITVGEPPVARTVLSETATVAPVAANGVNIQVNRTIKAREWSTICLPFAMTAEQVANAFGTNAQLAHFAGYTVGRDDTNAITSIKVNFETAASIEPNHPYIIKVPLLVESFQLDNVDIAPAAYPVVEYDNGQTGGSRVVLGSFIGTYVAETIVPNHALFLSGNKFWYSVGLTKMMAYRAYFDFSDVLADVENASARISVEIDGNETDDIQLVEGNPSIQDGMYYDLQGRRLDASSLRSAGGHLKKGIYISRGKKVLVK